VPVHIAIGAVWGVVMRRPHPQPWRSDVVIALNELGVYDKIDTVKHDKTGVITHTVEVGRRSVQITPEGTAMWRQLDYVLTGAWDNPKLARELARREETLT